MKEAKIRKSHNPELKAKVALEAMRGVKTVNQIGLEFGVHPGQVGLWKKELQEQAKTLFEGKRGPKPVAEHCQPGCAVRRDRSVEGRTGLAQKKVWYQPVKLRQSWIEAFERVPLARQCALAGVSRSAIYEAKKPRCRMRMTFS